MQFELNGCGGANSAGTAARLYRERVSISANDDPRGTSARDRRRAELRDYLRSRRERLTPAEVGLPEAGRRRTPGLRREEVAVLAGVTFQLHTPCVLTC